MRTNSAKRKSLMLTLTHQCNLDCIYCYEGSKSKNRMHISIAKESIAELLTADDELYDEVEIDFHGGEPFLMFRELKEICEWTWSRSWRKPYVFFATTNGTLVHGAIRTWVEKNKHRLYLALSLDGTPDMHDQNRSNSYNKLDVDFFCRNWPDQPVKMTVSPTTLPQLAEGLIYLHRLGFQIQCNLAHGIDWSLPAHKETLTAQLELLIDYYLDHPELSPCDFLAMDLAIVGALTPIGMQLSGGGDSKLSKWCGIGTAIKVIDVDGRGYPCHLFLPISAGEQSESHVLLDFSDCARLSDSRCQDCAIVPVCPTCYAMNQLHRGDPAKRDEAYCELTKIRALVCSNLQARMLADASRYPNVSRMPDRQKLLTIIGIQAIQDQLAQHP
ncbi:MAG: 4Fe-4S cluster-binding domain-containing protein [Proteobacteria bacterium]|nr:4Fe-4S cluster-binding domain-containing protein [Pseudomonadota bacterium]